MADRYWVNDDADGDFGNANNWSASDGGAGGAGIPGSSDDVYFTDNETANCTLDQARTVTSLTNGGGYTGTFDLDGNDLDVGDVQFDAGTFDDGGATLDITGHCDMSGCTYTATGTLKMTVGFTDLTPSVSEHNNVTFDTGDYSPIDLEADVDVAGTLTLASAGFRSNTINLSGDLVIGNEPGNYRGGLINWTKTGNETWTPGTSDTYQVKFNSDRTVTLGADLTCVGGVEVAQGTLDVGSGDNYDIYAREFVVDAAATFTPRQGLVKLSSSYADIDANGTTFYDLELGGAPRDLNSTLTVSHLLTLNGYFRNRGGDYVTVTGDMELGADSEDGGNVEVKMEGSGAQTITGNAGCGWPYKVTVNNSSGNPVTVTGTNDLINDIDVDAGELLFAAGYTYTFDVGATVTAVSGTTVTFDGSVGSLVTLVSDDPADGNDWNLDNQSGSTVSADCVDVQNANATNEVTPTNSTDSGWNTNWTFGAPASSIAAISDYYRRLRSA